MFVSYACVSEKGRRPRNEDSIGFYQSKDEEERRTHGAVVILADGVGGAGQGDIASKLAVESATRAFLESKPNTNPSTVLFQMFNGANHAIYDARTRDGSKMGTTLSVSLFRNNEVNIAHVGDCRVYLIQAGRLRRVTNDHSYAGVQVKLGIITVEEAQHSDLRTILTRSVGQDMMVRADYHTLTVNRGDYVVQCCDGLYCYMSEGEIYDIVTKIPPEQACQRLVDLALSRSSDDNLSVQIVQVKDVERLSYYRGLPIYQKVPDLSMGTEIEVSQLLDDRYLITDIIARSGMATIYKANDQKTNRAMALKVPFLHLESDPNFYSRFKREEEIGKRLNHPYILHIDAEDADKRSRPYMVMEYLDGQTLGHLMRSIKPMPVPDALKIISHTLEALHYMHEHEVVHRDMKPDNIMICNDGSIRIMDFGIAKVEGARRLTFGAFQPAMGTPDYMAPEQVKGKRGDARTDIYSIGAMLYEMVTGQVPFEGSTPLLIMNARVTGDPIAPRKVNPEISPQVEEIILHAMARDPALRYPTAWAMKQDVDAPDKAELTGRADRLQAPMPWKSGWRRMRLVVLCVVLPLAVFGVIQLFRHLDIHFKK